MNSPLTIFNNILPQEVLNQIRSEHRVCDTFVSYGNLSIVYPMQSDMNFISANDISFEKVRCIWKVM